MYKAVLSYYKVNTVKLLSRSRNRTLHHHMSQSSPPHHDLSLKVATILTNWSTLPCLIVLSPMYISHGFSGGTSGKESTCQYRRRKICKFDPWVGKIPWRRKRQPTPVFLPGKFHGQRSLTGYSPWSHLESDMMSD